MCEVSQTQFTLLTDLNSSATECYRKAAILASLAAHTVANSVKAGARLADLCLLGDRLIAEQCLEAVNQGMLSRCPVSQPSRLGRCRHHIADMICKVFVILLPASATRLSRITRQTTAISWLSRGI